MLLIDNCSAHPDASQLISDDGEIEVKFLPPNVTALIQPMDQGVLQALKRNYKKKLIRRLVLEDDRGESVLDFLKSINMKSVVKLVSEAWDEVKVDTFRKSWRKIIPLSNPHPQPDPLAKSLSTTSALLAISFLKWSRVMSCLKQSQHMYKHHRLSIVLPYGKASEFDPSTCPSRSQIPCHVLR